MTRHPSIHMQPNGSIPTISGSAPGILDSSQTERLLRVPGARLTFAAFDPRVATAQDIPDLRKLSIKEELYRPKRVVVETVPTGESFWRFVPSARKEEGIVDEGVWPRHVELCGQIVNCTQDQWDIYKLDPLYECFVRGAPLLSKISRVAPQSHPATPSLAGKRRITPISPEVDADGPPQPQKQRMDVEDVNGEVSSEEDDDDDDDEDEVEGMIIDNGNIGTRNSRGPPRRTRIFKEQMRKQREERREKIAKRANRLASKDEPVFTFAHTASNPSSPYTVDSQGKRKADSLFDSLRGREEASGSTNEDDISRNGAYYAPSMPYKRTRTVSPSAAKRNLETRRLEREKQKRERREKELNARREQRDHHFMQQVFADIQEAASHMNGKPSPPEYEQKNHTEYQQEHSQDEAVSEEAQRLAAIEESRRKLAELEKDRPIWEEKARIRREQERAEEHERHAKVQEKQQAEALKAKQEKQAKSEEERRRQEDNLRREKEARVQRERERRQRRQRWAVGAWTTQRALEKYKTLCESFDNTKFSETEPLSTDLIPWPTLHSPATFTVEDVDWTAVENFFEAVRSHMKPQDYKLFVQSSHRRFHPDRWRSRSLLKSVIDEAERGCIEVAANTVAQALTPLWRELTGR